MSNIDYNLNDDLSDLLGDSAPAARQLPQDEGFARIRQTAESASFVEACPKCKGTGRFVGYTGRILGDCFTCKGAGKRTFKTAPADRANAAQRRAAQPGNRWDAFVAAQPDVAAWILRKSVSFEFAMNMKLAVEKYGELTERQLETSKRLMAQDGVRDGQRAQQRAERAQAAPLVDVSKLVEAFAFRAKAAKKAVLRFNGVTLSLKDASTIYVKSTDRKVEGKYGLTGEYLGKIIEGRFIATRACTPADTEALKVAAADPLVAAVAYGRATSSCSCCGRTLTNGLSIELGIGPICRSEWGF